ncbi:MAG TPA: ATP-binding protein, partial [Aquihabitans sp.]|nr:ATP-binding protein [Aquihabitans sp.]
MSDRIELSPAPSSVAVARRWSTDLAARAGFAVEADTVALLVSELVTNVVLHARTTCELVLIPDGNVLRVEVRDGSNAMPAESAQTDPMALSGRGMVLIDALSTTHGAEAMPGGGKLV